MSMIERAARALAKAQSGSDEWEGLDGDLQSQLKAEALAVIEAIREPSGAMASAGEKLLGGQRGHSVDASDLRDAWVVMVDALNKGVSG
ncbi:MAG: hypothetical protein K0R64_2743 [Novosphingobium lindaniclasticum]|jgi:hypothetical protein|uniref:hypothetical protein n=1 Tax=Novosphingobium lindaniclasticum TaxID=1329895 RepID=UPI00240A465D|nr:hypothetical protein [Novosphingobium lindaniclasticum]MDF2639759.1 hypothetical protein [Novosphingobium lindaniclasticum]